MIGGAVASALEASDWQHTFSDWGVIFECRASTQHAWTMPWAGSKLDYGLEAPIGLTTIPSPFS